jgi:hypothetical protein
MSVSKHNTVSEESSSHHLILPPDEPLIGIILQKEGREEIHYFTEEAEEDTATPSSTVQDALNLAGSWSDLDWDEVEREFDQIRHARKLTPPISL